jgi:hypothetical protein
LLIRLYRIVGGAPVSLARNSAAAESEGGAGIPSPHPLPFCPPERSVLVLPREARQSVGISFKMSSDFFQQTPPKFIYSVICLARGGVYPAYSLLLCGAPGFGGYFGKIIPRIFEINRQFSRRKAAVHKLLSLYCDFVATSRWFSFAFGEIQNEILAWLAKTENCLIFPQFRKF